MKKKGPNRRGGFLFHVFDVSFFIFSTLLLLLGPETRAIVIVVVVVVGADRFDKATGSAAHDAQKSRPTRLEPTEPRDSSLFTVLIRIFPCRFIFFLSFLFLVFSFFFLSLVGPPH